MYNISLEKNLLGFLITLILIFIVSFFFNNILTPKKESKYAFWYYFGIIFGFYLISKINDTLYSNRAFLIMIGYIVAVFTQSKDKWSKKVIIFLIAFIPNLFLNAIAADVVAIKEGYTISEYESLIATEEGYYAYTSKVYENYTTFVINGLFNVLYCYILVIILIIKNYKYSKKEIIFITTLITILSITSGLLSYFYLSDLYALIILMFLSIASVVILLYAYQKLRFYKKYFQNLSEIKFLKEREDMQYHYYKDLINKEDEIHKIKHDLRNDLQVISELSDKKKKDELLKKIDEKINLSHSKYCKNNILNILLNLKKDEALKRKINLDIHILKEIEMEEIDLINLFSNILDNAINSASEGKIELIVEEKLGNLIITCRNTINPSKQLHGKGYGKKILKEIVQKYDGTINYQEDDEYLLSILIPIK